MRPRHAKHCPLTPVCALLLLAGWGNALWAQNLTPAAPASSAGSAQRSKTAEQLLLLAVSINGKPSGRFNFLDRSGVLYAQQSAFQSWQVKPRAGAESIEFHGQNYWPLAAVPGFEARVDFANKTAVLRFLALPQDQPAQASAPLRLRPSPALTLPAPPSPTPAASPPAPVLPGQPPTAPLPPIGQSASAGERFLPLDVNINNAPSGQWLLLERRGVLYAPEEAFDEWRINRRPDLKPIEVRRQNWYALNAIPGFTSRLNFANQSVDLVFASSAFNATKLATESQERAKLSAVLPAAFLNYDFSFNASANRGASSTRDLGLLTEIGYSGNFGVITSSFAALNLGSNDPSLRANVQRLETTYTRDFPASNQTLRIGDTSTRAAALGRSIYFGGVQFGKNFALSPGFVTQAIPVITGTSSAPSTVELYINDALRQTSSVPTGPFAIDNFPLLTGSGQARVVVRDLLGRETVLVQPFFTSANLLEEDLLDYSAEAGAVRRNLGTKNFDYGEVFSSGTIRYGLSKSLTIEGHAELGQTTRSISGGASVALPFAILGQAALALSNSNGAVNGAQASLGLEKTGLRHGFSARVEASTRDYRQVGVDSVSAVPQKLQFSANYSYADEELGALGLGLARIESFDRGPTSTVSANYSLRIGQRSSLTLSATRAITRSSGAAATGSAISSASSGSSFGISFTMPLDGQLSTSSSVTTRGRQTDAFASISKGLTAETGYGWRALAGTRQSTPYSEAGLYRQGNSSLLSADISASREQQNIRLGAQGGLVLAGGQLFASRQVQDSFALVEVAGYPNVGVGFQGSNQTRTNADGFALLPRLQAYQANNIRLDPNELPINAEIDSIEQVVVPASRSGVKVTFPVRSGRAALIKLVFDDGQPAPAGAELVLQGDKKEFFVARRGEAFITGLQNKNTLALKWNGATCNIAVELDDIKSEDIARLGPLTCSGVTR